MTEPDAFDPKGILDALREADVDFVVIGGLAGLAHGSQRPTRDVDLAYARDKGNLERLAGALRGLGARLRGAPLDVPFLLDAKTLAAGANFTFATDLGPVDILSQPDGAPAYERLAASALLMEIAGGPVRVASLDDLIAMKSAAGRPRDLTDVGEYRVIAEEARRDDEPQRPSQ